MTDEKRCGPPEHLRGSDGEHFVCGPNGAPFVALWHAAPHAGIEPLWHNAARTSTGTPAWAANEWGWRYVAPVTPPDTVAALVGALEGLMRWHPAKDTISRMGLKPEPAEAAYEAARVALALYRGTGR